MKKSSKENTQCVKCSFCPNEKTRVVFVYICDAKECESKARGEYLSPIVSRTTFS